MLYGTYEAMRAAQDSNEQHWIRTHRSTVPWYPKSPQMEFIFTEVMSFFCFFGKRPEHKRLSSSVAIGVEAY